MKPVRSAAVILVLLLLLAGCGKQELNQMALVMAVGLDKDKSGTYRVTAQIVRPADARGSTGAPSGGTGEPVWTASAEGASIFEAIRNLSRFSSRRVFWAHNKVIVVGEDLAKDNIVDLMDFFTRNHELRMNTWIVMTPGKAADLVITKTGMEVVPGDSIDRLFRFSPIVSEAPRTTIKEVTSAYLSRTSNPVMAIVKKKKRVRNADSGSEFGSKDQVELSGTAVFRKEKMVGTLTPEESRALLWFIDKVDSGVFTLPCPDNPKLPTSLELKHAKFKIEPGFADDQVSFDIKLDAQLDLVELGCPTPLTIAEAADQLEEAAAKKIQGDVLSMLNKAQKVYKTDFLDLGKTFQNRYPGKWMQIHGKWSQYLQEADIKVQVSANIKNPVLLILPTKPLRDEGEEVTH